MMGKMSEDAQELTSVLNGGEPAGDDLLPLLYEELRKLAVVRMAGEKQGHTLQPTALVHEAWLRLTANPERPAFANRAYFFAAAAESMRRILIERARKKSAEKRGGPRERVDLEKIDIADDADNETLLLVNEALEKLAQEDAKTAELVKLRFFGGLTLEEAGQMLGVTERTAKRYWAFARAWLYDEITSAREQC
jgi:RNA polymerase sigma factor (TIGR02999 family)